MNGLDARYTFLPWLRRGLSAAVGEGATLTRHLQAPVEISFGAGRTASVVPSVMVGPGEVAGLDPRVASRAALLMPTMLPPTSSAHLGRRASSAEQFGVNAIQRQIGHGSSGVVYLGHDPTSPRPLSSRGEIPGRERTSILSSAAPGTPGVSPGMDLPGEAGKRHGGAKTCPMKCPLRTRAVRDARFPPT